MKTITAKKTITLVVCVLVLLLALSWPVAADSRESGPTSDWPNFRGNGANMGIADASTPANVWETNLLWAKSYGAWPNPAPSVPIIIDEYVVVSNQYTLSYLNKADGTVAKSTTMDGTAGSFAYVPPTYIEEQNMLVVPQNNQLQAFDATTLESLWVYRCNIEGVSLTRQAFSPITYDDGRIYTGFWAEETLKGVFVCLDITDEATSESLEEKQPLWTLEHLGGFYWSGAYVQGDYVIFPSDNGKPAMGGAVNTEAQSVLYSCNKLTGAIVDSKDIIGDGRSSIAYDSVSERIYFTSKAGYLYSAQIGADGKINDLKSRNYGGEMTSTPVVYKGRLYAATLKDKSFIVANADTLEPYYTVPLNGYCQSSPLLSTAYEAAEDGTVYLYMSYQDKPGGISLIKDKPGQTEPVKEELFTPIGDMAEYGICSVICDSDGTLYYKNDSNHIMAVESNRAYLSDLRPDVGQFKTTFGPQQTEFVLPVASTITTINLAATAPEGATVTPQFPTITLSDGEGEATITVTKDGDTRQYTVKAYTMSNDATLSDLRATSTNTYENGILALTPSFSTSTDTYSVDEMDVMVPGNSMYLKFEFVRLWPTTTNANASVEVSKVEGGGADRITSRIVNDRTYYGVYFQDGYSEAKVRIRVTSEDLQTQKDYYATVHLKDTIPPALTEVSKVRLSATEGTVTFNTDDVGSYYYAVVDIGATPPAIDTSGTGDNCLFGNNTIAFDSLNNALGKDVYIKVKNQKDLVSQIKITLPEIDVAPPDVNILETVRLSETTAEITFNSNEPGTYYYGIVDHDEAMPAIDTSGAGTACVNGSNTFTATGFSGSGQKDIYLLVKDAAGNANQAAKAVIAVVDATPPTVTLVDAVRSGVRTATITFHVDEIGYYYYAIVEQGTTTPTIDTSGGGSDCVIGDNTLSLGTNEIEQDLRTKALDVYLCVKDRGGNVSPAMQVSFPAFGNEAPKPQLTAGTATRQSAANATATFTTNEDGTYYYAVAAKGGGAPTIDTAGDGIACAAGKVTIAINQLVNNGAKDLYVQVKDRSNNVSEALKIHIPEFQSGGSIVPPPGPTPTLDIAASATLNDQGIAESVLSTADADELAAGIIHSDDDTPATATVEIALPKEATGVQVTIPQTVVDALSAKDHVSLEIQSDLADILLDPEAVREIVKAAGSGNVTLLIEEIDSNVLSQTQQDMVGEHPVYKVTILADGKPLANLGGGTMRVAIAYALGQNEEANLVSVYRFDGEDAEATQNVRYDSNNGKLVFDTDKSAIFGVVYATQGIQFSDVQASDWFYADVLFVVERNIMKGIDEQNFGPEIGMTRAMFVTVLGRYAGVIDSSAANPSQTKFDDVPAEHYYAAHVAWAIENGITMGTSATSFAPDAEISRQDMAAMMARYVAAMGVTLADGKQAAPFADDALIDDYAKAAIYMMKEENILNGKGDNRFDPLGTATRSEVAAVLHRFIERTSKS